MRTKGVGLSEIGDKAIYWLILGNSPTEYISYFNSLILFATSMKFLRKFTKN